MASLMICASRVSVLLVFCGRNLVVVVLTNIKYSNENHYRERDENQHHVEQMVPLNGCIVGPQRSAVPLVLYASYWRSKMLPSRVPLLGI
jgi:hypothetical protein